jgi:hypothetical protein
MGVSGFNFPVNQPKECLKFLKYGISMALKDFEYGI